MIDKLNSLFKSRDKFAILIMLLILFLSVIVQCQEQPVLFAANWNVENLFDIYDDPDKDDSEFLPSSEQQWTQERLEKKFESLARVIRSMNDGRGPDILGVEEIENQAVLELFITSSFKDKYYKIAYAESPDNRGIDVGLVYNADIFSFLSLQTDTVFLPDKYPTRLVLTVNLLTKKDDTLHIIINHWPSRRGGEKESEVNRIAAAAASRKAADRYLVFNPNANILLLGDFNDEPTNSSLENILKAKQFDCTKTVSGSDSVLFNLAYTKCVEGEGSYLYKGDWNMLDQIIISKGLSDNYQCGSFEIYKPDFMVTRSGRFQGAAFPTYGSGKYLGGYSDHFPVTAKFKL